MRLLPTCSRCSRCARPVYRRAEWRAKIRNFSMLFGCPWLNLGLSAICSQVVTTTSAIFFASSRPSEAPDFEWRNTFYDASKGLRVSQSRFSIVLVGVSALLRRPLVSRLRPAGFTARGSGGFRRSGWPLRFGLPLGGLAFGLTASAFRHAPLRSGRSAGWFFRLLLRRFRSVVGLRVHCFRFSARTALELPSSGWFLRLPFRSCRSASWPSGFCFRFSACAASEWPLGEFVLPPSVSEIALGGLAFGLTASAFRHAPLRSDPRRVGSSAGRVGLRAHCFRFSACTDSHRRTAEARTDGAHRHDTCFTSKHLSQHVNLPHRTP